MHSLCHLRREIFQVIVPNDVRTLNPNTKEFSSVVVVVVKMCFDDRWTRWKRRIGRRSEGLRGKNFETADSDFLHSSRVDFDATRNASFEPRPKPI